MMGAAHAVIVDASNLLPSPAPSLHRIDADVFNNFQTFTVENDGHITGARVQLSNQGNFVDNLDDVIVSLDVAGTPDLASVLASATRIIDFDNIGFDVELFQFDFSVPFGASVGDRFALRVESPEKGLTGSFWAHGANTYLGGDAYFATATQPNLTRDFGFEILVDGDLSAPIPVPAAALLFAPGLLGGLALRRRR